MKKLTRVIALLTAILMTVLSGCAAPSSTPATSVAPAPSAQPSSSTAAQPEAPPAPPASTEPVEIEFWHTLEEMYRDDFNLLVDDFMKENPNIKVNVMYQGRVAEILKKVLAANVAGQGNLPDVFPVHSSEIKRLAGDGIVEKLDSYIAANGTDISKMSMKDCYALDGSQYGLTWTITGMCWFYNQTIADQEKLTLPTKWEEMDGFLRKAAIKNADGTTKRYGLWVGGWDSYYFTWMLWNSGVMEIGPDGSTTINSDKAKAVIKQVKGWIDEGLMMWGYGKGGSTNMRQAFWDGQTFAIVHTSSQYINHKDNMEKKGYKLGACLPPAGADANTTEVFGMCLSIPSGIDAKKKAAAYKLIEYLASPKVNLKMASFTGFLASGTDTMKSEEGMKYLKENPAMQGVYDHIGDMTVAVQMPCYPAVTDVLEDGLALIFLENKDIPTQLDAMAAQIKTLYEDQ